MSKPSLFARMAKLMSALKSAIDEGKGIHRELERAENLSRIVSGLGAKQRPRKRKGKK